MKSAYLTDFHVIRPKFSQSQPAILEWVAKAHTKAEENIHTWSSIESDAFYQEIKQKLVKLGFGQGKIQTRGMQIDDFLHDKWEQMSIYDLSSSKKGSSLTHRTDRYNKEASCIFEQFYPEGKELPSHLIHTSCTGYISPSPAQKLVSLRDQGHKTTVTHAYHMGCYGAIPSIRMAVGFLGLDGASTDIVHTELCSLHLDPANHSIAQLVIESLFADGFIKYTLRETMLTPNTSGLKLLAVQEKIIPNSEHAMTWACGEYGFAMSLSKEVPLLFARELANFVHMLLDKVDLTLQKVLPHMLFAVHPGGPKIIETVETMFSLEPHQIVHSKEVLYHYGNMSSATLPHIWDKISRDSAVSHGTYILSLAFGPGLTLCGALFQKESLC